MKTLKLLYPEWQGYGQDDRACEGAYTVHEAFSKDTGFIEIVVPRGERLCVEDGILGRSSIVRNSMAAFAQLKKAQPDRIFMIGGTCGSEIVPVSYLNQSYNSDLAVLWFDAHGDLNTPESSPSAHFHGMVLRTLLGDGDQSLTKFVPSPLSPSQVTLIGVRDLDTSEAEYTSAEHIPIISPDDLINSNAVIAAVKRYETSNLYIHLDLDFFNPDNFKGAQVPHPGGISMNQLIPVLSDLNSRYTVVGLSVVEFASNNLTVAAQIPALFKKSGINWPFT
ncbi:MAG: arginase family protein [Desulfobacterales bacterium]|nr:arginase family protein [Desulfobacterales bacterium]